MAVPKVNQNFLAELESIGFSLARATRALHYSGESAKKYGSLDKNMVSYYVYNISISFHQIMIV